jgi:hypothetical protein
MRYSNTQGKQPYLHLEVNNGLVQAKGDHRFDVGHRLGNDNGSVPEGVYSSWNWNGITLEIKNCRFGFYPLFYLCRPGEFFISSSLPELLRRVGPQDFDDDAIAVFLRVGFLLGDDTPFRDIKVVPPASDWQWTNGGLIRSQRTHIAGSGCASSRDSRLDDYISLFQQAMKRRPAVGNVVLPLSGGRDSRHILFELVQSGAAAGVASMQCVSSEAKSTLEDVRVAQCLSHALGMPHRVIPHGKRFVPTALRKNLVTSFCSDEHTWAMPMCDSVNQAQVTLYDGLGGGMLSGGAFSSAERLKALRAGRAEEFVADLFWTSETELQLWLRPEALVRFSRERAVARATAAVSPHCDQPNPIASFLLQNRTRREIATYCCCMFRPDSSVYLPYFDHSLFDYLSSIPGEDLNDKTFHTDAISKAYPQWAQFPYALDDGDPKAAMLSSFSRRRFNTRLAFDTALYLLQQQNPWVDRMAVIPRLATLVGAKDAGRSPYWFSTEKILWATQLERFHRSTAS